MSGLPERDEGLTCCVRIAWQIRKLCPSAIRPLFGRERGGAPTDLASFGAGPDQTLKLEGRFFVPPRNGGKQPGGGASHNRTDLMRTAWRGVELQGSDGHRR